MLKRPKREADDPPPSNFELKNAWSCAQTTRPFSYS